MGIAASIYVDFPLPDGSPAGWFNSTDLGLSFDDFRLTPEGLLTRAVYAYRSESGTNPDDMASGSTFLARMRRELVETETVPFDGFLRLMDGNRIFSVRMESGRAIEIRTGGLDAWVPDDGDPWTAITLLALAFSNGRQQDPDDVSAFLDEMLSYRPLN